MASYAIVAETPERALGMLDGMPWPEGTDRLRILDEEEREALAVERPAGDARRRNRSGPERQIAGAMPGRDGSADPAVPNILTE